MSHISDITEVPIRDLVALETACLSRGLELDREAGKFKRHAGDTRGRKCSFVIRKPGSNFSEIGVVKRSDSYALVWDEMCASPSLIVIVGEDAELLLQDYTLASTIQSAQEEDFRVMSQETNEKGEIVLRLSRG